MNVFIFNKDIKNSINQVVWELSDKPQISATSLIISHEGCDKASFLNDHQ